MARREGSIQYIMCQNALEGITGNKEINRYKAKCKEFAGWIREEYGIKKPSVALERAPEIIQAWEKHLEEKGYSPWTIHTYLAPICKGLNVPMGAIEKPKRTSDRITRGRDAEANPQGRREATMERYKPLVDVQNAVGLRRTELKKLRGRDLQRDESGYICVHTRGKNGKEQLQRVLPDDLPGVLAAFRDIEPNQLVFPEELMKNKINLHGLRADQGYRTYQYYKNRLEQEPEYRRQCQRELALRFREYVPSGHDYKRFTKEIMSNTPYKLRGANREKAERTGRPVEYNRLALMMVSVFHLSHWRLDVTVTNYILQ